MAQQDGRGRLGDIGLGGIGLGDIGLGGIGAAFADRNFRLYSVGSVGSWIGHFVQLVAVSWLTWQLTGATIWLAAMALLDILPTVVLMPVAGALADRTDRHRIMLVTSALLLVQSAALAALAATDRLTVLPLAGLVLLHGILISFMVPAMYGTLPRFVGRAALPSAIAVAAVYTQLAVFAGPALAGWVIAAHGVAWAFIVNAGGYLGLLAAFLALRTPAGFVPPTPSGRSLAGDIGDGWRYVRGHRLLWSLLLLGLAADAVLIGFYHMLPAFAETVLGLGVAGMAAVLAGLGLGATAAGMWLAHGGVAAVRLERVMWGALAGLLLLAVLVMMPTVWLAVPVAVLVGVASETRKTGSLSLIQLSVDETMRGRVMGTWFMLRQVAGGIGALAIGGTATAWGVQAPTLAGVALAVLVWLWIRRRCRAAA